MRQTFWFITTIKCLVFVAASHTMFSFPNKNTGHTNLAIVHPNNSFKVKQVSFAKKSRHLKKVETYYQGYTLIYKEQISISIKSSIKLILPSVLTPKNNHIFTAKRVLKNDFHLLNWCFTLSSIIATVDCKILKGLKIEYKFSISQIRWVEALFWQKICI